MDALNELVEKYPRWGFWKLYDRLRLLGHPWNHKRVYRVYKAMNLNLPRRTKRRLPKRVQQPMVVEARANAEWSLDFMSDTLYHGRRFRTLNILDEGVREALDIVIDTSIPGGRVVRTLDRLIEWRGKPDAIRVDNGPEYISQVFADWCQNNGVTLKLQSYCQIWCMPRKSSGDLVGLFDLFSVNKCHAFNDLCQVFEAA